MHDRNEVCIQQISDLRKELDKHIAESPQFRDMVVRHDSQILTLEKAQGAILEDIRDIRNDLKCITVDVSDIKLEQSKMVRDVKIWILGGMLAGIFSLGISVFAGLIAIGESRKQLEIDSKRLDLLEQREAQHVMLRLPERQQVPHGNEGHN